MAILSVNEQFDKRAGERGRMGNRNYVRSWQVITDDPTDNAALILNHDDLPNPNEDFPDDPQSQLDTIRAVNMKPDQYHWIATAQYRTKDLNNDAFGNEADTTAGGGIGEDSGYIGGGANEASSTEQVNAWDKPPIIRFESRDVEVPVDKAYATDDATTRTVPIENSAQMPFDPPVVENDGHQVISITRNEQVSDFNPDILKTMKYTINAENITIAGVKVKARKGRILDATGQKTYDPTGRPYYTVAYKIEVMDKETQDKLILDLGYYQLPNPGCPPVPIVDSDGAMVTEPLKLDGNGLLLAQEADAVYVKFRTRRAISWKRFNFPREK